MKYILAYNYVGSMYGIKIIIGDEQVIVDSLLTRLQDTEGVYTLDDILDWAYNEANEWQTRDIMFTITDMSGKVIVKFC